MKKSLILVSLFGLFTSSLFAQIPHGIQQVEIEKPASPDADIDFILAPLDKSGITSNLLMEKAYELIDYKLYDESITPSVGTIDLDIFTRLYGTISSAALINTAKLPDPRNTYIPVIEKTKESDVIPIMILNMNYHRTKDNALDDNLIYEQNGQYFDTPNRTEEPYATGNIFVATSVLNEIGEMKAKFRIDENLIFDNTGKSISKIEVDFGTGYQIVNLNQPFEIVFATIGENNFAIKITFTDETSKIAEIGFNIDRFSTTKRYEVTADETVSFGATANHSGAIISIAYSCGDHKLRKPLIVVEGFHPPQFPSGDQHYFHFHNELLTNNPILKDELEIGGYDVVYIDYNNGAESVERKSALLEEVINWVNNQKAINNSDEKNVVLGISMGGLVSRYTLKTMENLGLNHDVRKLILHDSPQQGANVPLGYQHMLNHIANYEVFGVPFKYYKIELLLAEQMFNTQAAKQLLLVQAYHPFVSEHTQLFNTLNNLGYPNIEIDAISNGSEISEGQGFLPHEKLFHTGLSHYQFIPAWLDVTSFFLGVGLYYLGDVWSLPNNPSNYETIYSGTFIKFVLFIPSINIYTAKVKDNWPLDSGPGGNHDIYVFAPGALSNAPSTTNLFYSNYAHVPTVSGLDISLPSGEDNYFNVQAANIIANGLTPFERYSAVNNNILPNIDNEFHTSFTVNNAALFEVALIDFDQSMNLNLLTAISNETYNYGETTDLTTVHRQIYDVTVDANGKYCVNNNIGIGYLSAGNGVANSGSNFDVYIGGADCNTQGAKVTVNSGGEFIIGDNSTGNTSTVYFQDISELILNSGGKLIIRDNCTVIMESETKFTFMDGAQIELQGNNSVLEIRGDVVLGNNALFTFTGSGFVRWDVPHQGFSNITAGTNSGMKFQGSARTDKVLEIKGPDLWLPNNLSIFRVQSGLVEFKSNARLVLSCPFFLTASNFVTSTSPFVNSRGVWLGGQPGMFLAGCHFYNTDIDGDLIYGGNPLKIQSCQFFDFSSVDIDGAGLQIVNSNFTNCPFGIVLSDIFLPSYYNIGNMDECFEAVNNFGSNTSLSLYKVNINTSNSQSWGIYQDEGLLNLKCTQVTGGFYGIVINQNASLNSSIIGAIGGYSKINGTYASLLLQGADMINLDNGFNDLRSGNKIITGTMNLSCPSGQYDIPANQNKWLQDNSIDPNTFPGVSAGGSYPNAYVNPTTNTGCDVRFIDANRTDPVACGTFDGGGGPLTGVFRNCTTCPMINTPHFNNVRMDDAVVMAMEHMEITDTTKNDFLAIIMFNEIVAQSQLDLNDQDVAFLAKYCYQMSKISFQNCFNTGRLTKADNTPSLHTCANHYLEILDALRQPVDVFNYKEQFYLELDNALIYYWVGRYTDALHYLNNIENCFLTDDEYRLIEYWKETITLKNSFVTDQITFDEYIERNKLLSRIPIVSATTVDPNASVAPSATIGTGTQIGSGSSIGQNVIIGKNCRIGDNVIIENDVIIGNDVTINDNSAIKKQTSIGDESKIGSNVIIEKEIIVGNNVSISNGVTIANNVKIGDWSSIDQLAIIKKETEIADGAYIGENCLINQQSKIGSHAIVRRNSIIEMEVSIGDNVIIDNNSTIKKQSLIGKAVLIGESIIIGQNAKLCDASIVNSNIGNNGVVGSCSSPSLPSQPFNISHDEIFAVTHAHIYGKMDNGFTVSPEADHYFVGQTLTFDANKYGSEVIWDFGNCSQSTSPKSSYTFTNPGVYVVTLKVNPPHGCTNGVSETYIGSISIHPKPTMEIQTEIPDCASSEPVIFDIVFDAGNTNAPGCMSKYGTYCTYSQLKAELCRFNISSDYGDGNIESNQYLFSQLLSGITKQHTYQDAQSYSYNFIGNYEAMQLTTENWIPINYTTEADGSVSLINSTQADFVLDEFVCANPTYSVINTSFAPYELYYNWNLSDGQSSTEENPIFDFSEPGEYTLTLETSDWTNTCSDIKEFTFEVTTCQLHSMTMNGNGTEETSIKNSLEVKLFPNPNSGDFAIVIDGISAVETANSKLMIFDSYGKLVYVQSNIGNGTTKINLNELSSGIYHWYLVDINVKKALGGNFIISN